jgi:hypothetical protein
VQVEYHAGQVNANIIFEVHKEVWCENGLREIDCSSVNRLE